MPRGSQIEGREIERQDWARDKSQSPGIKIEPGAMSVHELTMESPWRERGPRPAPQATSLAERLPQRMSQKSRLRGGQRGEWKKK